MDNERDKEIKVMQEVDDKIRVAIQSHTHDGVLSWRISADDLDNWEKNILYRIVKNDADTAVNTTVGGDLVMPFGGYITGVGATVDSAGTTGTTTVDINKGGTTILTTKITIDTTEKTSRTAAVAPVFTNNTLTRFEIGDIFTFDIDVVHTTPAKGLTVFMDVIRTT